MCELRILQCGWTPFLLASQAGHWEVVLYLIEKFGIDVNVKDEVSDFVVFSLSLSFSL
jgi:hypothetical protein